MTYDKRRDNSSRWHTANPDAAKEASDRFQGANRERLNGVARTRGGVLRTLVFNHYGWLCSCCGSAKNPTIDHVDGDGAEHREQLTGRHGTGGVPVYRWLVRNGFPEGFQTLCRPCNRSKGTGPACRIEHGTPTS